MSSTTPGSQGHRAGDHNNLGEPSTGSIAKASPEDVGFEELPSPVPQSGYNKLDPAAVPLWRIEGATSAGVPLLGLLVGGSVLGWFTPTPWWVIVSIWLILACVLVVNAVWLPQRKYDSWSYRMDERVLELRYGLFWQNSVMIPLSRLQHVDLRRSPLERRFGVSSLEVYTAGTKSASHTIPYLRNDIGLQLREQLVEAARLLPE